jgi:hypothetical protein
MPLLACFVHVDVWWLAVGEAEELDQQVAVLLGR